MIKKTYDWTKECPYCACVDVAFLREIEDKLYPFTQMQWFCPTCEAEYCLSSETGNLLNLRFDEMIAGFSSPDKYMAELAVLLGLLGIPVDDPSDMEKLLIKLRDEYQSAITMSPEELQRMKEHLGINDNDDRFDLKKILIMLHQQLNYSLNFLKNLSGDQAMIRGNQKSN